MKIHGLSKGVIIILDTTIYGRAVSVYKEVEALYYYKGCEVSTSLPGINVIES